MEPSTLTDSYGALLTTTLRAVEPQMADNISKSVKFLGYLQSKGRMRSQDGGERVRVPLMYGFNSTSDIYSGYGLLDTTPQDNITSAFYSWAQFATSITISRLEERQNSGRSQALDLLKAKTTQAMASMKELVNNSLVTGRITTGVTGAVGQFDARRGRLDSGASAVLPLPALIDATAARSRTDIGNINPATYSFWANQSANATAVSTFAGYKSTLNHMYNLCSRGAMGSPDLLLGTQMAWEQYWGSLQTQERYIITDARTVDVLGGSSALAFRDSAFIWDEVVPDAGTNGSIVDNIGLSAGDLQKDTVYFINSECMEWVYDAQTNFITTPMMRPENQDARTGQILWMGIIGVNNRRKHGVVYNISHSAFTS